MGAPFRAVGGRWIRAAGRAPGGHEGGLRPGRAPDSPGQGLSPEARLSAHARTASSWGWVGGASGTPPAPTGAVSQFWGTKFGFKTHTARTLTQNTARDVCPAKSRFLPQNRACHQATHAKTVRPLHSQHPSPWVSVTVPRVLSQPCVAKNKETQRPRVGQSVSCLASLGRSWRRTPPPHPLGSLSEAPGLRLAAPHGQPLRFHPFATQTNHLACLTLHRVLSQTSPGPFQPPT